MDTDPEREGQRPDPPAGPPSTPPAVAADAPTEIGPPAQRVPEQPAPEQPAPERRAPEQRAPEQRATGQGATWFDRYRVIGVLGEGGMGTVYRAEQLEPVRREVALKVVRAGRGSREVLARFELERRALAAMSHSAIAKVFDAGATPDGRPYFVMELVPGLPLTVYADQHRLTLSQRIELFRQVCAGLQHAHQKGVVHRDLKPGNILVVEEDGRPVPKILDFGLAKATTEDLQGSAVETIQHALLGTPEYMAPEQAGAAELVVDTRADIYSLGVVLYELLSGELPFAPAMLRAGGFEDLVRILRSTEPARPSSRVGSDDLAAERRQVAASALPRMLRGDLDWIVLKAMAKEPEQRYSSAAELSLDLQRFLEHEPVLAGPPSTVYRLRKLLRRYRAPVSMAAGLVVVLVAGLWSTTMFMLEAQQQRELARQSAARAERSAAIATEARAATHLRAARLCYERGAWQRLLDECAAARATGLADEHGPELSILEVYGLVGAQRTLEQDGEVMADALARLAAIDRGPHLGEALLLRGVFGHNRIVVADTGLDLVRQAIAAGTLPESLALCAQSLLTSSLGESMDLLRRAIDADPHCRLANSMIAFMSLFCSDDDERRRLRERLRAVYPEDTSAGVIDYFAEALFGDVQEAERLIQELRDDLPEVELFRELAAHARREMCAGDRPGDLSTNPFDFEGLLLGIQVAQRMQQQGVEFSFTRSPIGGHPSVYRGIAKILGLAGLKVRGIFQSEQQRAESLAAFGEEATALAPWGVYLTIHGLAKLFLQDYAAAEQLLERAIVAPSFFRIGAWRGRLMLLNCHRRWTRSLVPDSSEFAALQQRMRRNIVELLRIPGIRSEDFETLAEAAVLDARDPAAAELVVAAWREQLPADVGVELWDGRQALFFGAPARALLAVDRGLARVPDHADLQQLRQMALDRIGRVGVGAAAVPLDEYLRRQSGR